LRFWFAKKAAAESHSKQRKCHSAGKQEHHLYGHNQSGDGQHNITNLRHLSRDDPEWHPDRAIVPTFPQCVDLLFIRSMFAG
jgi:hypothetical protein